MTNYFCENIKKLRKEKGLTQDELASVFGISFQSVSKWERGESYPDITLLPSIAHYFGVSTDSLLGVDKAKKEEKVNEYIKKYDELMLSEFSGALNFFKNATKEFPGEYSLLVRYLELLISEKDSVMLPDYEQTSREIASIYENINTNCTDDSIRIRAKMLMCRHLLRKYQCKGYNKKHFDAAQQIVNELPSMISSKEYVSLELCERENYAEKHLAAIEELLHLLQNVIVGYCYYEKEYSSEYKIKVIENLNSLFEAFCPRGKNFMHLIYNYGHLGHLYHETGDDKKALKFFSVAAEAAIEWDGNSKYHEFSKFYETENKYRSLTMCERMTLLMNKHYSLSQDFKESEEFKKIIEILCR